MSTRGAKRESKTAEFFKFIGTRTKAFFKRIADDFRIKPKDENDNTPWYKLPLIRRLFFGIVSILLAMLMWGYVLMEQNPDRTKVFYDIAPTIESGAEADLTARKLTIYGNISEILGRVNVTVSAPITDLSKVKQRDITATVSLSDVHSAGTYTLEIKATCSSGTVVKVEPSRIQITVDDVASRTVPIKWAFTGELPEGYWHDTPQLYTAHTQLEGAKTDLQNVSEAVCLIDLTDVTSSINRSIPLIVLDKDGNQLDSSLFKNIIPSVNISMKVLPHKVFDVTYNIIDRDQLPDIYEIRSETLSVTQIDIAADPDTLEAISGIFADPISIGDIDNTGSYNYTLSLKGIPDSAKIIDGTDKNDVRLTVVVVDAYMEKTYQLPIQFVGEDPNYSYEYSFTSVAITISGPAKAVNSFVTSEIVLSVNVASRGPGVYDILIEWKPASGETIGDLTIAIANPRVNVYISPAASSQ